MIYSLEACAFKFRSSSMPPYSMNLILYLKLAHGSLINKVKYLLQVHLVRDKITWPGARIRKKDEGMPNYENNNKFGTLFITFDVVFPKGELSQEEKQGRNAHD